MRHIPRILPTLDPETLAGLQAEAHLAEVALAASFRPSMEPIESLLDRYEEIN